MASRSRSILVILGVLVAIVVAVIVAVPLFLNADSLRARMETTLSGSLGRKVTIGKLNISILSGGLVAENASVADDPKFSSQPFLQAASVKIGVELLPLIVSRQVHVKSFDLESPRISLLRGADGVWNYSSIGAAHTAERDQQTQGMIPNLTVSKVDVHNGQLSVSDGPGVSSNSSPQRTYDQLNLSVTNFSFGKSFPFTASAHLPGDAQVSLKGAAGPINQQDASLTPFTARLDLKHLDPLAAGFLDQTSGVSGLIDSINVDAAWSGQQLHIAKLVVGAPHLTIVRTNKPGNNEPIKTADNTSMWTTMSIDDLSLTDGSVTLTTPGSSGPPAVYQQMNATLTNFSGKSASPFTASAQLPGGGSMQANGTLGPLNPQNSAATPVNAQVALRHIDLAASGVAPAEGIGGLANFDARIASNGQTLNAGGTAHVDGLRLARNGLPSAKPVDLRFTVNQNIQALTGEIQQATMTIGRTAISASGTYQSSGATTAINLKVNGNAMPIDELEAFLPSLGVKLPSGSRLQGGTLTTSLSVTGSSANPVINGPVRIENTQLAGFDLGSKLSTLTALTGTKTGSVTSIRSLSMDLHSAGGALRTDNLNLVVPALGTATGNGTVGEGGALDYHVILKLAALGGGGSAAAPAAGVGGIAGQLMGMIPGGGAGGSIGSLAGGVLRNGVPVAIGGTTTNPTFAPNLQGLLRSGGTSAAKGLLGGVKSSGAGQKNADPLGNVLGGLLNRH